MEAQQIKSVVERALLVHAGTTTSDGNVGGTTAIDSSLTALPDYDGLAIIINEGVNAGQARDIDGATTGGTITVATAFGAQVVAGINYYILASIPQTAEVAAVQATVDEIPSESNSKTFNASALASINVEVDNSLNTAIPGSPTADSINERIKTLDDNYTATRAGYLDQLDFDLDARLGSPAGASISADIAAVAALVDSAEAAGPYSYLDTGGEQTVKEDTATTRRRIWVEYSNRNMTQTGTFRIYRKIDGSNYDLWAEVAVTVGAGDERAFDSEFTTNQAWKLTYEEDANEGAARNIPYNVITQVIE